jgi:hypothetical protein
MKGVEMLNEENRNLPTIYEGADYNDGATKEDALRAAAEAVHRLDAHGKDSIPLHMDVARKVAKACAALGYGELGPYLRDVLKKSRSWVRLYKHLDADREHVGPARAWAAETDHRLANAQSAESLLKLVSDYLKRNNPAPPKQRPKEAASGGATGANLSKIEADTDEFVAAVVAQANDELAEIARIFQSTVHDLVAQIRSGL